MVLYEQYKSPSLGVPYSSYPLFDLDDMDEEERYMKMKKWSSQWTQFMQLRKISLFKYTCNGRST